VIPRDSFSGEINYLLDSQAEFHHFSQIICFACDVPQLDKLAYDFSEHIGL
jgi:hypothetical protein